NLPELFATATFPNVALKATGAPSYSSEAYPYRDIHGHIRRLYDAFGPERMFWGTDITRMPCPWRQCVTMFTEELPWLSARDTEPIMRRPLATWLDGKLPAKWGTAPSTKPPLDAGPDADRQPGRDVRRLRHGSRHDARARVAGHLQHVAGRRQAPVG